MTDSELQAAWDKFCETLKGAKELVFRENVPSSAHDRAAGLRYLSRSIPLALDFALENADPLRPELTHLFDWRRKQAGDNQDGLTLRAPLDGRETYRITGKMGNADFLAFTVAEKASTPWGGKTVATLLGNELKFDKDDSFELILSATSCEAQNQLVLTENSSRLLIRQMFADWGASRPIQNLRIERLGERLPAPSLTPEQILNGLQESAIWLVDATRQWYDLLTIWQDRPMEFFLFREVIESMDATPGGEPYLAYWEMARDEAIIIRVRPPQEYRFWNFELGNWWFETVDYRYRLTGTNNHQAVLEEDGELILVVAHEDPGVPNWLDAGSYSCGYVCCRWMAADSAPRPSIQRVRASQLHKSLPANAKRADGAFRKKQLASLRDALVYRFQNI